MSTFFKDPKKFLNDAYNEAKPTMLTFGQFPLLLLGSGMLLAKLDITGPWETAAIEGALFALFALVTHMQSKGLGWGAPKAPEGYNKLENEAPAATS